MTSLPPRAMTSRELRTIPPGDLPALAYGVQRLWTRAWQDVMNAPAAIGLSELARRWNISYDVLRKMHNAYFTPDRRPALADLQTLSLALDVAQVWYEEILLASAGYLLGHTSAQRIEETAKDGTAITTALTLMRSRTWITGGGVFRAAVIRFLEAEHDAHMPAEAVAYQVAVLVGAWHAYTHEHDLPNTLDELL